MTVTEFSVFRFRQHVKASGCQLSICLAHGDRKNDNLPSKSGFSYNFLICSMESTRDGEMKTEKTPDKLDFIVFPLHCGHLKE